MANVTVHVFHRNDLNGTPVFTIDDEDPAFKGLSLRMPLGEMGGGEVRLSRAVGDSLSATEIGPEAFVRVIVHAISDTRYVWGFFLTEREHIVLSADESAGEDIILRGPGPLFYLDTIGFWHEKFATAGGTWDTANGVVRFDAGVNAGRALSAMFAEDAANTVASTPTPFLPDLTRTFDVFDDSSSTPWAEDFAEEVEFRIGDSILTNLWLIQDAVESLEYYFDLGSSGTPKMELNAFDALIGGDRTGTSLGAGKVIWKAGVNVLTGLTSKGRSRRKASQVLVRGDDGSYAVAERPSWDPGEHTRAEAIDRPGISNVASLERRGKTYIRKWDEGDDEIELGIIPGFDEAAGFYFPDPDVSAGHFWLGDSISLKTGPDVGASPLDYDYSTERVTGIRMVLGQASVDTSALTKARSWEVIVELNIERGGPSSPTGQGTGGGCTCVRLTHEPACESLDASTLDSVTTPNADAEATGGWSNGAYLTAAQFAGAQSYGVLSGNSIDVTYTWPASQVFSSGVRYVLEFWHRSQGDTTTATRSFGVSGVDETTDAVVSVDTQIGVDGQSWDLLRTCWTPTADRTGVRFRHQATYNATGIIALDDLAVYNAGVAGSSGGSNPDNTASPASHGHEHNDLAGRAEPATHPAASVTVADAGGNFTGTDVEAVLAELSPGGSSAIDWFIVTAFGAIGDGTTDDTAAIQAAIDAAEVAGGVVYFPIGTYRITSALTIQPASASQSIRLLGASMNGDPATNTFGAVIVQETANTNGLAFGTNAYHAFVEHLKIMGPTGNSSGYGLSANRNIHTNNVWVQGFHRGYGLLGTTNAQAYYSKNVHLTAYDADDTGIYLLAGVNNADFFGCRSNANGVNGFFSGGAWGVRWFGGAIEGNGTYGARIDSAGSGGSGTTQPTRSTAFYSTYFENASATDIRVGHDSAGTVYNVLIDSCQFIQTATNHVTGQYFDGLVLQNNFYQGGKSKVSFSSPGTNLTIVGHEFGSGSYGTLPSATMRVSPSGTLTPVATGTALAAGSGPDVAYRDHVHTNDKLGGVTVSGTPSADQVLTATSSSAASWQAAAATDNTAGMIPVDTGAVAYDTSTPGEIGITVTSDWGYDGVAYYDDTGAAAGEEASLWFDPATGQYAVITFEFP